MEDPEYGREAALKRLGFVFSLFSAKPAGIPGPGYPTPAQK